MKQTILFVDDDTSILTSFEFMIDGEQNIIKATSGEQAIEILQSRNDVDLIFMDVKMGGISGLEAAEIIRKDNKSIPIFIVTAYEVSSVIDQAKKTGCTGILFKPVIMDDFFKAVNTGLGIKLLTKEEVENAA